MVSILSRPQCVNHAPDQYLPLTAPRFLNNEPLLACMMLKFHPCLEQSQKQHIIDKHSDKSTICLSWQD